MKVHLLYSGDTWLSKSSLLLLAVCSTKFVAISLATEHAKGGEETLIDYDLRMLERYGQTYGKDSNYLVCETDMDTLD